MREHEMQQPAEPTSIAGERCCRRRSSRCSTKLTSMEQDLQANERSYRRESRTLEEQRRPRRFVRQANPVGT
jgi:hypothetical protein